MKHVDHTHPYADSDAVNGLFRRGPRVAADGGERRAERRSRERRKRTDGGEHRDATAEEQEAEPEKQTMKDVSHTPPDDDRHVNRVFERGGERTVGRK